MSWNFKAGGSSTATVYFPASGCRRNNDGELYNVGYGGYYWSAVPHDASFSCLLVFGQWGVSPQGNHFLSYGFSVRPVAEPKTRVTPKTPGSTEEQWGSEQQVGGTEIDLDN